MKLKRYQPTNIEIEALAAELRSIDGFEAAEGSGSIMASASAGNPRARRLVANAKRLLSVAAKARMRAYQAGAAVSP